MVDEKTNEETEGQSLTYFKIIYLKKNVCYIFIPVSGTSFAKNRNM